MTIDFTFNAIFLGRDVFRPTPTIKSEIATTAIAYPAHAMWMRVIFRGRGIRYHCGEIVACVGWLPKYPVASGRWCVSITHRDMELVTFSSQSDDVELTASKTTGNRGTVMKLRRLMLKDGFSKDQRELVQGVSSTLIPIRRGVRRLRRPYSRSFQ